MKGFTIVEIIIISGIIALALASILQLENMSLRSRQAAEAKTQAVFYLEEGYEVLRALRDGGWDANIASLGYDTEYYLVLIDGNWQVTNEAPPPLGGKFVRTAVFSPVYRDEQGDITDSGGTPDGNTRKAAIKVEWSEHGAVQNISGSTYLTNWRI